MLLYVTRHGETDYNAAGRYCGVSDIPINATGQAQARDLARRLARIKFDAVVASPMLRARQTADIICAAMNAGYSLYSEFVERNLGVYEGLTRDEIKARYPELWNRQCTAKPDDAPDGGETIRQACARIDGGMMRLRAAYGDKTILLVCHGFAARAINRYCHNLSFEEMANFTLENCAVVNYSLP